MIKRSGLLAALLICASALIGTTALAWNVPNESTSKNVTGASVTLPATSKTIKKGATFKLTARVSPSAKGVYAQYSSSNSSVVSVNQKSIVKGKSYGDAVVTVNYGDATAICEIKVTGPLKKITLNANSSTTQVGEVVELRIAAMEPFNADVDINSAQWSSSKSSIANVSGGRVTASSSGKTVIAAKLKGKVAKCTLVVNAAPASGGSSSGSSFSSSSGSSFGSSASSGSQTQQQTANSGGSQAQSAAGSNELRVLELVNQERAKAGLSALKYSKQFEPYARLRAGEIIQKFSHTRPDGSKWSSAVPYKMPALGENIGMNFSTPESVMNAWMNSPSHKENIMKANYQSLAVGISQKDGIVYWTQLFVKEN